MIWLADNQDIKISDKDGRAEHIKYMKENMTSAEEYTATLKTSPDILANSDDIIYRLNQLMDIYVTCQMIGAWIEKNSKRKRIGFFKTFSNARKVKKTASLNSALTKTRFDALGGELQGMMSSDLDEFCEEFARSFSEHIKAMPSLQMPNIEEQYLWAKIKVCLFLHNQFYMHIRVYPDYTTFLYNGETKKFPDFIDGELFGMNEKFEFEETPKYILPVLKSAVAESLKYYIEISQIYLSAKRGKEMQNSITTINIQQNFNQNNNIMNVTNNNTSNVTNSSTVNHNEIFNFVSTNSQEQPDSSTKEDDGYFCGEFKQGMFEKLCLNKGYITFKSILAETEDYFKILIKLGYVIYDVDKIEFRRPFSGAAFAELLKDNDFKFSKIRKSIPEDAFIKLFGKTFFQLEQRENYPKGYRNAKSELIKNNAPMSSTR